MRCTTTWHEICRLCEKDPRKIHRHQPQMPDFPVPCAPLGKKSRPDRSPDAHSYATCPMADRLGLKVRTVRSTRPCAVPGTLGTLRLGERNSRNGCQKAVGYMPIQDQDLPRAAGLESFCCTLMTINGYV